MSLRSSAPSLVSTCALFVGLTCGCAGTTNDEPGKGGSHGGTNGAGATGGSTTDPTGGSGGSATTGGSDTSGGTSSTGGTGVNPQPGEEIMPDYGTGAGYPASWTNVTGTLAGMSSECGNFGGVFANPYEDQLVTGVANQGLWGSNDGGDTWAALGASSDGSNSIKNRLTAIVFDPSVPGQFWESGIYGWEDPWTQGVFKTIDHGASFVGYLQFAIIQSHQDSVSVDFTDADRKVMISGGHEQKQTYFRTTDGGTMWEKLDNKFPQETGFCTNTLVVDSSTFLIGCNAGFAGGSGAILISTDTGDTFTSVSTTGVEGQPIKAHDGNIYWAAQGGGLQKSTDLGTTWTAVSGASGRPIELPDGRIAAVNAGGVVVSADGGGSWTSAAPGIPFDTSGIAYNPFRRAFYVFHADCGNAVPGDAVERFGWDFLTQ